MTNSSPRFDGPYRGGEAINLVAADHSGSWRGLWVGGAGNVKVDTVDGSTITFNSVAAGTLLRVLVKKVYKTGTTATNMVGLK